MYFKEIVEQNKVVNNLLYRVVKNLLVALCKPRVHLQQLPVAKQVSEWHEDIPDASIFSVHWYTPSVQK
jgi:hypothetical protein